MVSHFDAAGPSRVLMLPAPPIYQAGFSHQLDYGMLPRTTYHLPCIMLSYDIIQQGMLERKYIPLNTEYGQLYFPLPADLLK